MSATESTGRRGRDERPDKLRVGRVEDLPPGSVTIVDNRARKIGVFNVGGRFYALSNHCIHRGGPACLGERDGLVKPGTRPSEVEWLRDGEILRCPWHGWEFDIATGTAIAFPDRRLRTFPVTVEDGVVSVQVR